MEPRQFRQGNCLRLMTARRRSMRFNGAPPIQAGKPETVCPQGSPQTGFNGAPPIQAGKPSCWRDLPSTSAEASMEPRQFRQGNSVLSGFQSLERGRFNGAPPIQAGKLDTVVPSVTLADNRFNGAPPIQAGKHAVLPENVWRRGQASMEPRQFRQGNLAVVQARTCPRKALQWSPANSGRETAFV